MRRPRGAETAPARRVTGGTMRRARRRTLTDIEVGERVTLERVFTPEDGRRFATLSGDFNPLHVNPAYAHKTEFKACVVPGMLIASLCSTIVGMHVPGERALFLKEEMQFRNHARFGEKLSVEATVLRKQPALSMVVLGVKVSTESGSVVAEGELTALVRGESEAAGADRARPRKPRTLRGHVALVTGSSRGLGAAVAAALGANGIATVVNYRKSEADASRLCRQIVARGGRAVAVKADVTRAEDVAKLIDAVYRHYGRLDIVVNNAYEKFENVAFADVTWQKFQRDYDLQVRAAFLIAKHVLPGMIARRFGRFVSVLSSVVLPPLTPGLSSYTTAKSALMGLTRSLAAEYALYGITANMVSPTMMDTDLTATIGEPFKLMYARSIPLRRLASPEDVVAAVLYLVRNEYVSGVNIPVTGGLGV